MPATLSVLACAVSAVRAGKPARADANALIAEAAYLVSQQNDRPADEVRALDKQLDALQVRFSALGRAAVPALAKEALDDKQQVKTRLWLILYLQSVQDATAFPALRKLTLDPAQPDMLRDASARALAASPVGKPARARALCQALSADPGPQLRQEALFEVSRLGCDDPAPLERWASAGGPRPSGREATEAAHALSALRRSLSPSAVDSLDRLLKLYAKAALERGLVLDALLARAPQLKLETARWNARALEALREESRTPANAVKALRLVAALGEPSSVETVARYLDDPDPNVVVAAAETLAALGARDREGAVAAIYRGFYTDARFANGPGVEPVPLYDRLGAALKALK